MKEQIIKEITEKVMVKLAKHEVNLNYIQDLKKLESRFQKEVFPIFKEISTAKKELRDKGKKAEAKLNKIEQEIAQSLKLIEKAAKDLGLNVSEVKEYNNVKALEKTFAPARTVFQSVQ
ncbi:MAG: hypothetical protein ACPGXZ_00145 [Saprospiraceae bacterium]